VYEHQSSEHPLTLYIGKRAGLPRSTTAFSQNKNVSVVYWQAGPLAYGLVGRIDRETLLRLAGDVDLQIRAKPPLPKQYVRQPAETKPGMIRAEPVRAEPAVVRPVKTDKRDAVDETKSMPPAAAAPEIPATKPAATGETSQPNKT
jgi:hypothetical protein